MRNKKKMAAAAGLAAVMVIGGTWAYFSQTAKIENPFSTGKYDSIVIEDFKPDDGDNWVPGATINKDVTVNNTGDYDLFVRVRFDEKWQDKGSETVRKENKGMDASTYQASGTDGLVVNDKSVVKKIINKANEDKWVYNADDGYWYYKYNLKAKNDKNDEDTTGTFLDAVQLIEDADMGLYTTTNYYTTAATAPGTDSGDFGTKKDDAGTKWVAYTGKVPSDALHNMALARQDADKPGYGNAEYTLTITVETVQATKAAMESTFGLESESLPGGISWTFTDASTSTGA